MLFYKQSEATAARRRVPLYLVDATDGITPETAEAAGQPQLSKNGAAFANTTATLTAIGNGAYYVELTAAELDTLGMAVVRYKSAATAECNVPLQVLGFDLFASTVTLAAATHTGAVIPTVTAVTNDVGITQVGADKVWATTTRAITDKAGFSLSAAGVQAIWDALTSALTVVGSIGKRLADNIDATISSRSTYAGGAVASVTGSVGSVAAGGITAASFGVGAIDAAAVATDAVNEIADGLLDRDMGAGVDSGSPTLRTVRQALRALRNRVAIAAGTMTVYRENDTTASWTATVTTAAGNPITEIDPPNA